MIVRLEAVQLHLHVAVGLETPRKVRASGFILKLQSGLLPVVSTPLAILVLHSLETSLARSGEEESVLAIVAITLSIATWPARCDR